MLIFLNITPTEPPPNWSEAGGFNARLSARLMSNPSARAHSRVLGVVA